MYGCENNSLFAIKCIMKTEPMKMVMFMMIFAIIIFGGAVRICESPVDRVNSPLLNSPLQRNTYFNSIWEVILTMTTVGFGDIYPRTWLGRSFLCLCAFNGVFIVSLMVLSVMNTFEFESLEKRAYIVTSKVDSRRDMREISTKILQKFARMLKAKRNGQTVPDAGETFAMKAESQKLKEVTR